MALAFFENVIRILFLFYCPVLRQHIDGPVALSTRPRPVGPHGAANAAEED
jgi:hypothetical protein